MKNQAVKITLLSVLCQLTFSSAGVAIPWPELKTDQQKLEYGLALRERMPKFFSDTFNYGIDWWSMAETQERMKEELSPLYPAKEDTRPLVKITLNENVERLVPSGEAQAEWKAQLQAELARRGAAATRANLISELEMQLRQTLTMKPKEILNALMKEATQKDRNFEIMKAPMPQKIAYLKEKLPEDLTQTSFYKNSNRRYTPDTIRSRDHAIELLETIGAYEESIPTLTALVTVAGLAHDAQTSEQIQAAVARLSNGDFAKLNDKKEVEAVLRKELNDTSAGSHDASVPALAVSATASITKQMQKLMEIGSHGVQVPVPTFSMTEVPRDLSIMRSTVALDCTHTCSFAKVDDPTERIYYVNDLTTGKLIGYVEGQIKTSEIGDVFYLTSINGPTFTPKHAHDIIEMLYASRKVIGVNEIAIAANNLGFQMNYQAIIDYIEELNHGKPRLQVRAKNPKIASIIDSALDADYQKENENKEAVVFKPKGKSVSTTFEFLDNSESIHGQTDPKKVLLFALELDAAQRTETPKGHLTDGERAVSTAGLDVKDYRELRKTLQNRDHLPYQRFLDTVAKEALSQHGFELDKAFINAHAHVFYDAQLAASDAVEGSLQKSTFQLVAQLIKRGLWHPTWGLKEFGKDPAKRAAFDESRELEGVMRWGMIDLNFHSIQMRNMVQSGLGFAQMRSPEVVRELLRLVADGWSWGPDLTREMLLMTQPDIRPFAKDEDPNVRKGVRMMSKLMKIHDDEAVDKKSKSGSNKPVACKDLLTGN